MKSSRAAVIAVLFFFAPALGFSESDGSWLKNVPAREQARENPYQAQQDAIDAGKRLFSDHCAQCHGTHAEGIKKRPPLTSERVQREATAGDLHWLLVNGNMRRGMPSWAKLPDPQLWEIITFIKTLH